MSFANFGIGLGAFAQGLNQGMETGAKLRGAYNDIKLDNAREKGMEEAKAARQSAIDNLVQVGSTSNADNTMTMPTFNVGGQSYGDEAAARSAAEKEVDPLDDFYHRIAVPKIYEEYMQIDPEKAEIWMKWNEDKQVRKGKGYWARGVRAASMGDYDNAGKYFMKAYNTPGYYEDGNKMSGFEVIKQKGKDGKEVATGVRIKMKMANGEEVTTDMGVDEAMQMGAMYGDPKNVLEYGLQQLQWRQKQAAEIAKEDRQFQRDIYRDDRNAANQSALQSQRDDAALERTVTGKQMDAANKNDAVDRKVEILKRNGYADEWIAQNLPAILGIGEYKKAISPDDARLRLHEGRIKNDYSYARKSQAEQRAIIEQDMQMIYGSQPQQRSNPLSGGISGQGARPTGRVPMIYDTTTGKTVPYSR